MDSGTINTIVGVGIALVIVCVVLVIMLLREMWNASFDRMRDEIKMLSNQVDRLERQQDRMKGSIEGMREGRLTGIKPEGRFRG